MATDLKAIATVAAQECFNQQLGVYQLSQLLNAYTVALTWHSRLPDLTQILTLGRKVEAYNVGWRKVPVDLYENVRTSPPNQIHTDMLALLYALDIHTNTKTWVREFLRISPFTDGNQRVAWILYNWLEGTLESPSPLPDFHL